MCENLCHFQFERPPIPVLCGRPNCCALHIIEVHYSPDLRRMASPYLFIKACYIKARWLPSPRYFPAHRRDGDLGREGCLLFSSSDIKNIITWFKAPLSWGLFYSSKKLILAGFCSLNPSFSSNSHRHRQISAVRPLCAAPMALCAPRKNILGESTQ